MHSTTTARRKSNANRPTLDEPVDVLAREVQRLALDRDLLIGLVHAAEVRINTLEARLADREAAAPTVHDERGSVDLKLTPAQEIRQFVPVVLPPRAVGPQKPAIAARRRAKSA